MAVVKGEQVPGGINSLTYIKKSSGNAKLTGDTSPGDLSPGSTFRSSTKVSRQKITRPFRQKVWESVNGDEDMGTCFTCTKDLIRTSKWHCSHICSDNRGGEMSISNMKPLCPKCNLAMKQQHMYLWMLLNNKVCDKISKKPSYTILKQIVDKKVRAVKDLSTLLKSNKINRKTATIYINKLNSTVTTIDEMLSIFDFIDYKLGQISKPSILASLTSNIYSLFDSSGKSDGVASLGSARHSSKVKQPKTIFCRRCGRYGYLVNKCYAKSYKNGNRIYK